MTLDTWGLSEVGWTNLRTGIDTPTLPTVNPISSQYLYEAYSICAQSQWTTGPYTNTDAWMAKAASLGVKQFRGVFVETNWACLQTIDACRTYGIKWVMLPVPESSSAPTPQTVQQTINRINWIADNVPDICGGIEGLNEPNQNRGDGSTTPGWEVPAFEHQQAIWDTAKARPELADIPIIGSSLHDVRGAANNGEHYALLADTGISAYMDRLGLHRYSNAQMPEAVLDARLALIDAAFGPGMPTVLTETGYHNGVGTSHGHYGTSEAAAAIYGPRALLGIGGERDIPIMRYALIDHEEGNYQDPEANFGIVRIGTPDTDHTEWEEKPEFMVMQQMLGQLDDPGTAYTPPPVGLRIERGPNVRVVVTAKRNGEVTAWMWRDVSVWDRVLMQDLEPTPVLIDLTWRGGSGTFNVGATVMRVPLPGA